MIALGERALGEEQPLEALRHFSGLAAAASVAAHPYLQVIATPSFVEAAARAGRANVVAAALDR